MTNPNLFVELSQKEEAVVSGGLNISNFKNKGKIADRIVEATDNSDNRSIKFGDFVNIAGNAEYVKNSSVDTSADFGGVNLTFS